MLYYLNLIWKKFTKNNVYDEKNTHPIINFISTWPNISFIIYVMIKNTVIPYDGTPIQEVPVYQSIIPITLSTLFFHGILFKFTSWSPFLGGIIHSMFSMSINKGIYVCFIGLSRRKYPLHYILIHKFVWLYGISLISKILS